MELGMLRGITILRTVALALAIGVVASEHHSLTRPGVAWAILGAATAFTALAIWLSVTKPEALLSPGLVTVDLLIGATMLLADGFVFQTGHVGSTQGGLAGSWPIAGVLTAALAFGPWLGLAAGGVMGVAHALSAPINGVPLSSLSSSQRLGAVSSLVLYAIFGVAAGFATRIARNYDDTIAVSRAREEMARVVHDGVLQTLALIPRRTSDPDLIRLAREQDRELRRFFVEAPSALAPVRRRGRRVRMTRGDLESRLRGAASRHLEPSVHVDVLVADDTPALDIRRGEALVGACSEALSNVSKHAGARRVTLFVEPVGRTAVFCSIKDDGVGFDPSSPSDRMGIRTSIQGRIHDAGGRVEIASVPEHGSEVRLWV